MDVPETNGQVERVNKGKQILTQPAYAGIEARMRRFIETYAQTGRLLRACETAGISFRTHYRKLESDPAYQAAFEEAEQAAAQRQEDNVTAMADDGDLQAAVVLLKRFRPALYRERSSVEISGSIDLVTALAQARSRMVAIDADEDTRKAG